MSGLHEMESSIKVTINMLISIHTWWKKGLTDRALQYLRLRCGGTWLQGLYRNRLGLRGSYRRRTCRYLWVLDKHPRLMMCTLRGDWRGALPQWKYSTNWHKSLTCRQQQFDHKNRLEAGLHDSA